MASTVVLQEVFDRMVRDLPRDQMPKGACWNLLDAIPGLGGPAGTRGGTTYASQNIASVSASASYISAFAVAAFSAGSAKVAIDEDGRVYRVYSASSTSALSVAQAPKQKLIFHREKLIIPSDNGTSTVKYYDGATTVTALTASAPTAMYGTVYADRTVLAGTASQRQRTYFSGPGDPTSWDTTDGWVDMSYPLTGVAALQNALLLFSDRRIERIRGKTPPPGSDMVKDTLYEVGCTDARSIAVFNDVCVFANGSGLYMTDGASVKDLTVEGGMKKYWQAQMASYDSSTWTISGDVYKDEYVVCIMNASTLVDAFAVNIGSRAFRRVSNIKFVSCFRDTAGQEELYLGRRDAARVENWSPTYTQASANKADANGTAVVATVETPWFNSGKQKVIWADAYVTYNVPDYASDNPTFTLSYVTDPTSTSYTAVTDSGGTGYTLAETTAIARVKRRLRKRSIGLGFKLVQSASGAALLYRLEAHIMPLDEGGL